MTSSLSLAWLSAQARSRSWSDIGAIRALQQIVSRGCEHLEPCASITELQPTVLNATLQKLSSQLIPCSSALDSRNHRRCSARLQTLDTMLVTGLASIWRGIISISIDLLNFFPGTCSHGLFARPLKHSCLSRLDNAVRVAAPFRTRLE